MKKLILLMLFLTYSAYSFGIIRSNDPDSLSLKKSNAVASHFQKAPVKSLKPLQVRTPADTISASVTKAITSINDTSLVLAEDIPMPVNELSVFENELYHKRLDSLQKEIPLNYNEFVQSYINLYAYHRRKLVEKLMGEGSYYFPIFEKALKQAGVPEQLKYLPIIESNLNPFALSRVGASGLWQFMYTTGRGYGLQINSYLDERLNPVKASIAAARYFKDSYTRYGDWLLVIASYNCGAGNVDRAIKRSGGAHDFWSIKKYLPKETRSYVPAFIAAAYILSYARLHGLHSQKPDFSVINDSVSISTKVALNDIAAGLNVNRDELRKLNPQYRRGIITGTEDEPLPLIIPHEKLKLFLTMHDRIQELPGPSVFQVGYETKATVVSRPEFSSHKVTHGETLSGIASRYDCTVQDLRVWNHLHRLAVTPGQHLKVRSMARSTRNERHHHRLHHRRIMQT